MFWLTVLHRRLWGNAAVADRVRRWRERARQWVVDPASRCCHLRTCPPMQVPHWQVHRSFSLKWIYNRLMSMRTNANERRLWSLIASYHAKFKRFMSHVFGIESDEDAQAPLTDVDWLDSYGHEYDCNKRYCNNVNFGKKLDVWEIVLDKLGRLCERRNIVVANSVL